MAEATKDPMDQTAFDDATFFEEDKESIIDKERKSESNPDIYRVSLELETVKNRQYSARGRFVRDINWKKEGKFVAKVQKIMYYIIDPDAQDRKMYVECPSNWNIPTNQNILSQAFFTLKDMDSVTLKRIAYDNFRQNRYWWSLFQIYIDDQQKELEGKVKIMRYGKPVNDIVEAAAKGQPNLGKEGVDVFSTFKGKDFLLNVFEKTVDKDKSGRANTKFPSYEKSSFDDSITSIMIGGKRMVNDADGRKMVSEYMQAESPSLESMEYVKWDEAMEAKVIESMRITIGDDSILNQILNAARKGLKSNRVSMSPDTKAKIDKADQEATNGQASAPAANDKTNNAAWAPPAATDQSAAATADHTPGEASFADATDDGLPNIETEFEQLD